MNAPIISGPSSELLSLKQAMKGKNPREAFIKLLSRLVDNAYPHAVSLHHNPQGKLPRNRNKPVWEEAMLSYNAESRFILTLAGAHHSIQSVSEPAMDVVIPAGELCWMPFHSWYLVRNNVERNMLAVVFRNQHTRFVWYHNLPPKPTEAAKGPSLIQLFYQTAMPPSTTLQQAVVLMNSACTGPNLRKTTVNLATSHALLAWCLQELLDDEHPDDGHPPDTPGQKLVDEICAYISDRLQSDLSRTKVASVFHISRDHLTRLFRIHTPNGYLDYVNRKRLQFAENLLIHSSLSIKEIGSACGFNYSAYFVKCFRDLHGVSPRSWRCMRRN
ncbi:AraC family transcriptional regulator [Termitidicoccus mucosus]|uniref:helix-turn-helix transcriptional regulator n=1 Tax=Termitidicoccus mucosus TaxID=1184151 RepID=UPI000A06293E